MAPKRLAGETRKTITFDLEGEEVSCLEGDSVATALLASGERVFARSVKYHRPRAPFCMAGECSHCLMRVDGLPNVFTCRTRAEPGMRVERQNAYPSAKVDVFASIDFLFPRGLDHHEMFAGVPVAEQVMAKVARQLAGLGLLPDQEAPPLAPARTERTRVAIVGSGPAGLAAAKVLTTAKTPFTLIEREAVLGGRLVYGPPESGAPAVPGTGALPPDSVRTSTTAVGLYEDEQGWFLAVVTSKQGQLSLSKLYADRFLFATGGHSALLPFRNNDLPGVLSGRAASTLLRRDRVLPGENIVLVGHGPELSPLAKLLTESGARLAAQLYTGPGAPPAGAVKIEVSELKAHGFGWVRRVSYVDTAGNRERVRCDLVVVSVPPAPSFELARQGGARVRYAPEAEGFIVEADREGRTETPFIFVSGDVTGIHTAREAAEEGTRVAEALVRSLS